MSSSKHLLNEAKDFARESIQGYLYANNRDLIALADFPNVVVRRDYMSLHESNSRVALISGGGSGHEPAHLGFIGEGMLTAVVCGDLFASPSTAAILAAIRFVGAANKAGVLMIVKNYTGDRLNFGLAAKRAQLEGINVEWVLVDDDVALTTDEDTVLQRDSSVGKRGLCGTVLIHKIAGALAEQRKPLKEIKETLDFILRQNSLIRTLGVSLSGRVRLPGEAPVDPATASSNEIEVGLGIHGESGRKRVEMASSKELARLVLKDYLFARQSESQEICLMVNNLGGLSNLELFLYARDCVEFILENRPGTKVRRLYCGALMTSLNMNGFSVTILNLPKDESQASSILSLLDAKTSAPAWPKSAGFDLEKITYTVSSYVKAADKADVTDKTLDKYAGFASEAQTKLFEFCLQTVCEDLIALKEHLNRLDSECGDGDCGNSLANISSIILDEIKKNRFAFKYPHKVLQELSVILENGGGSLCILLAIFMSAAATAFASSGSGDRDELFWLQKWHSAMEIGTKSVQEYGRARANQRTFVDPLLGVQAHLTSTLAQPGSPDLRKLLKELVDVAYNSAQATSKMVPMVGRASYVDPSLISKPDAGAAGVSSVFSSVYKAFISS